MQYVKRCHVLWGQEGVERDVGYQESRCSGQTGPAGTGKVKVGTPEKLSFASGGEEGTQALDEHFRNNPRAKALWWGHR